ncbi:aspartyl-phosphate phosphatase Spo0E family protein [Paenibacillus provencensis]|uniref:Aspartyl-phosphate phosphatase Spo0E family protein n=1 Tax=Paenibacillus provencensis TaxID=441151 RepID=A0ABW3Q5E6_9BACL
MMESMEQLLEELNKTMDDCKTELESVRKDMVQIGETVGLLNEEVLEVSQRLDQKIIEFMKVQRNYQEVKKRLYQPNRESSK